MSHQAVSRSVGDTVNSECAEQQTSAAQGERQSVSELVAILSDGHKRDRSESGDPAPAGKRGARERSGDHARSPSALSSRSFRDELDAAVEDLEQRVTSSLSRDLHAFSERMTAQFDKLFGRVKDLEQHVEERDIEIDRLTDELGQCKWEVSALQTRVEDAEINSRLPCLILSGAAVASRRAPRLQPPLPGQTAPAASADRPQPADRGQGQDVTSRPADRRAGGEEGPGAGSDQRGVQGRPAVRGGGWEDREDINALVVTTLNRCMPGLSMDVSDIDRAHRLPGPGPNNRVIVRFVCSGQDSVRDRVMARRLELRGNDLFINESLTKLRSQIFRSLLTAKRQKKIYTVYSRGGQVYFKEKQRGVSTRVDSLRRLRELGYTPLER